MAWNSFTNSEWNPYDDTEPPSRSYSSRRVRTWDNRIDSWGDSVPTSERTPSPEPRKRSPSPLVKDVRRPGSPLPTSPRSSYWSVVEEQSTLLADPHSARKLLILDLNGTLLLRAPHEPYATAMNGRKRKRGEDPLRWDPYGDPTQLRPLRSIYLRPYMISFRNYLFHPETKKWLDTMIWSSAQPHSVNDMVKHAFGERKDDLVAIWARDTLGLSTDAYHNKVQTTKDLEKPWRWFADRETPTRVNADSLPSVRGTLLMDDSPLKARLQPHNHLCIMEYTQMMRKGDLQVMKLIAQQEKALLKEMRVASQQNPGQVFQPEATKPEDIGVFRPDKKGRKRLRQIEKLEAKRAAKRAAKRPGTEPPVTAIDVHVDEMRFDETLLAVIGILETVKEQSNVANWMRDRNLFIADSPEDTRRSGGQRDDDVESSLSSKASSSSSGGNSPTSPYWSPEYPLMRPAMNPDLKQSGSGTDVEKMRTNVVLSRLVQKLQPHDAIEEAAKSLPWFEHQASLRFWAKRGREVLVKLGIEIVPGVKDEPCKSGP